MPPLELAEYVVQKCIQIEKPISNLQLQKILYFCQLQSMKSAMSFVMPEAIFEAWKFGPVIPDVYFTYCLYSGYPIYEKNKTIINFSMVVPIYVDQVIEASLKKNPWELVALSHKSGGAWEKASLKGLRTKINNEDIIVESVGFNLLETL